MNAGRSTIALLLAVAIVCPAMAQKPALIYDQLIKPSGVAEYHVPIGLCEDYPEETTTMAIIRGDMELLKRSGIHLLRISFGWDGIETAPGKYDWGFWDDYVKTAVDEFGITLIPYICYTPSWNSTGDTTNFWNHTPKDYEAFGQFCEAIVGRYKQWIKTWELWNEPDIDAYWSGTAADLARLTKIGARAVKRADPTAKVVLAGLAHRVEFTRELFRDHGISPYVDVVNCHSYYETWSGSPLESVVPYVNTLADIISRYGNGQSLWMAEVGYSTFRRPDGYVSESYWSTYDYEHTPGYQAVALWRTLTLLLSTEKLAAIAWYEIKDLPPTENVIGDVNNRNLGVARVDFTPKPAETALSFFNRFFSQKYSCVDAGATVTRRAGSDGEIHCFRMADGSLAVIGWLKTHVAGRDAGGERGNLKDTRQETVSVSLPFPGPARATVYSELGNEAPYTDIDVKEATLSIPRLELTGGTIAILKVEQKGARK